MPESGTLGRVRTDLLEWAEQHRIREAALAKAGEYLTPSGSRNGVPFSELKLVYIGLEFTFELGGEDGLWPSVRASYLIEFKRPRFRDRGTVGSFNATFLDSGFLSTAKFHLDDALLRELRRVPKSEG